jgi:hypothetical protein
MDALGLTNVVVIEEELRLLREHRLAVLGITVRGATRGTNDLLRWDTVNMLRVDADEVLTAAG